jgi:hypothetical protein
MIEGHARKRLGVLLERARIVAGKIIPVGKETDRRGDVRWNKRIEIYLCIDGYSVRLFGRDCEKLGTAATQMSTINVTHKTAGQVEFLSCEHQECHRASCQLMVRSADGVCSCRHWCGQFQNLPAFPDHFRWCAGGPDSAGGAGLCRSRCRWACAPRNECAAA